MKGVVLVIALVGILGLILFTSEKDSDLKWLAFLDRHIVTIRKAVFALFHVVLMLVLCAAITISAEGAVFLRPWLLLAAPVGVGACMLMRAFSPSTRLLRRRELELARYRREADEMQSRQVDRERRLHAVN